MGGTIAQDDFGNRKREVSGGSYAETRLVTPPAFSLVACFRVDSVGPYGEWCSSCSIDPQMAGYESCIARSIGLLG